jgi:hypothetical protein
MNPINDPHRRKRCCKGPLSVAQGAYAALRRLGTSARASIIRQMDVSTAAIVGLVGVVLGATLTALLTRRNERRSHSDELLAQAVNDAIDAIADVAAGTAPDDLARYASAVSRIALHGSPQVVTAWRRFQNDATTETYDGRDRLVVAVQSVREQLGHGDAADADLPVLLFGPGGPRPPAEDHLAIRHHRASGPQQW